MNRRIICTIAVFIFILFLLLESVSADTLLLPAGLKIIADEAFRGNISLDEVVIPNGTEYIGEYAFEGSSVRTAVIPDTVNYIAENAFDGVDEVTLIVGKDSYACNWAQGRKNIIVETAQYDMSEKHVTGIFLEDTAYSLGINAVCSIRASVYPATADDTRVRWTSSDEHVVKILWSDHDENDGQGACCTVLGTGTGTATVTAEAEDGGLQAECTVIVTDFVYATVIKVEKDEVALRVGEKYTLPVTVWPVNATDKSVKWRSSDEYVAIVNESTGEVTAVGGGTARIFAEPVSVCRDYIANCIDYCDITVTAPKLNPPVQYTPVSSGNCISVSWSKVKGASVYTVYYGESPEIADAQRAEAESSAANMTVTGLELGTKYYTWVTATDRIGGESDPSDRKCVTTKKLISTAPPQYAPVATDASITVSWGSMNGAESYMVYYGTAPDIALADHISAGVKETSRTVIGLKPGTEYYTWVSAIFDDGEGDLSERMSIVTRKKIPNTPVQNIPSATAGRIIVSWNRVNEATSYIIYYSTAADIRSADCVAAEGSETCMMISGLNPGTMYFIWVTACNETGESEASARQYAVTKEQPVLVPTQHEPEIEGTTVTLSWDKVADAVGYRVYYGTGMLFSEADHIEDAGDVFNCRLERLAANTIYRFWVCAVDGNGTEGDCSCAMTVQTGEDIRPDIPVQNVSAVTETTIAVSWEASIGAETYSVFYGTSNEMADAVLWIEGTAGLSTVITGLSPGTLYYVWVFSAGDTGMCDTPSPLEAKTENEKLPAPAEVYLEGLPDGLIKVAWGAVPGAAGYRVIYGTGASVSNPENRLFDTGNDCVWIAPEPEAGKIYYVWVCAFNGDGNGALSEKKCIDTDSFAKPLSVTIEPCGFTADALTAYDRMSNLAPFDRTDCVLTAGSTYPVPFTTTGDVKTVILELVKQGWFLPGGWQNVSQTGTALSNGELSLDLPLGLEAGIYQVRLYAAEASGKKTVRVTVNVTVESDVKMSVTVGPCDFTGSAMTADCQMSIDGAYDRKDHDLNAGETYIIPFSYTGDVSSVVLTLLTKKQVRPDNWTDVVLQSRELSKGEITLELPPDLTSGTYLLRLYAGNSSAYVNVSVSVHIVAISPAIAVLAVAEGEEGYMEKASKGSLDSKTDNAGSANFTKYAAYFDKLRREGKYFYNGMKNGYQWCDVFVDWCFVQAYGYDVGRRLLCQPEDSYGAGTGWSYRYYRESGRTGKQARVGAQIFIDWEKDNEINHTGLVYKVDDGIVYTIEGNSEDQVRRCQYAENDPRIYGYGYPDYERYVK